MRTALAATAFMALSSVAQAAPVVWHCEGKPLDQSDVGLSGDYTQDRRYLIGPIEDPGPAYRERYDVVKNTSAVLLASRVADNAIITFVIDKRTGALTVAENQPGFTHHMHAIVGTCRIAR